MAVDGSKASSTGPLLRLDLPKVSQLSSGGPPALAYMWTVFSKAADSLVDGRRLENIAWRLWYEDLCPRAGRSTQPDSEASDESDNDGLLDEDDDDDDEFSDVNSAASASSPSRSTQKSHSHADQPPPSLTGPSMLLRVQQEQPKTKSQLNQPPPPTSSSASVLAIHRAEEDACSSKTNENLPTPTSSTAGDGARPVLTHGFAANSKKNANIMNVGTPPTRRSSCPPSHDRQLLGLTSSHAKRAQRASYSSSTATRPSRAGHDVLRIRTHSTLTPDSLQRIIGTVLPLDFKNPSTASGASALTSPSLNGITSHTGTPNGKLATDAATQTATEVTVLSSPETPITAASTASSATVTMSRSPPPVSKRALSPTMPTHGILKRTPSPQRDPSLRSEKSFVTSTTASLDLALVDPVFSPTGYGEQQDVLSLSKRQSADSTVSAPPATMEDESRTAASTLAAAESTQDKRRLSVPTLDRAQGHMHIPRVPSHARIARPALAHRSSTAKSALQRTQSSKSVRILESPTNEIEVPSHKTAQSKGLMKGHRTSSSSSLASHGKSHKRTSSSNFAAYSHTAPKKSSSKTKLAPAASGSKTTAQAAPIDTKSVSVPMQEASDVGAHAPPPSPASPVPLVPASVVLPKQPYPSPSNSSFKNHSTTRRPQSPPVPSQNIPKLAAVPQRQLKISTALPQPSTVAQGKASARDVDSPSDANRTASAGPSNRKNRMFFISSPTTDSDDEGPSSFKSRHGKRSTLSPVKPAPLSPQIVPPQKQELPAAPKQAVEPQEQKQDEHDESEEEDDSGDEEDDSDWSSESTDEEDEHERRVRLAQRAEEARQNEMFAKRVPSHVNVNGGLLSQLLHGDRPRDYANLPSDLRSNRSAIQLTRPRGDEKVAGLDKDPASKNHLTVTGLLASKSTAAITNLNRNAANGRSGNQLTRLGGKPADVELESDDSDEEEGGASSKGDLTPSQHEKLANLMHKRGGSGAPKAAPSTSLASPEAVSVRVQSSSALSKGSSSNSALGNNVSTPRTTRRNMLSTELTESLRINLIWERQTRTGLHGTLRDMVAAVGERLAGQRAPSQPAPLQRFEPPARSQPPPRMQRGASTFAESRTSVNPAGTNTAQQGQLRAPGLPPRRMSDPAQDYYSPGFHHTGW